MKKPNETWPSPAEIVMMTPKQFRELLQRHAKSVDWSPVNDWFLRKVDVAKKLNRKAN